MNGFGKNSRYNVLIKGVQMDKKKIKKMFENMHCSECGEDFSENSFDIVREEGDFLVIKVSCKKCFKKFGMAFLGCIPDVKETLPLDISYSPKQITTDEVIDAHNFIKKLDASWQKHLPKDFVPEK